MRSRTLSTRDKPDAPKPARRNGAITEGRLAGLLGYAVRRAQVRVFQDFAEAMEALQLTPGQVGALLLIEANQGLSQTQLGAGLGIDRSSVVPLLDRLEGSDLIRRTPHASDRRTHALALTDKGAALIRRLLPVLEAHERRIAADLSPSERRVLMQLLDRVAAADSADRTF
ncbi:MAG TPA: MarR family transcriptional regulator [Alphaproteobacteria bacterium]|nr:MarR family transcriptional regulator [Alphaproteobacteria bacterium]